MNCVLLKTCSSWLLSVAKLLRNGGRDVPKVVRLGPKSSKKKVRAYRQMNRPLNILILACITGKRGGDTDVRIARENDVHN